MAQYPVKYRTFDQLLDEVRIDFVNYNLQAMLMPEQLFKVAKRVNSDLGLSIYQEGEAILELDKGHCRLPENFYVFNFGLLCGEFSTVVIPPQGTHVEEIPYPQYQVAPPAIINTCDTPVPPITCPENECNPCNDPVTPACEWNNKPRVCLNCNGNAYELVQYVNAEVRTYRAVFPLRLIENNVNIVDCNCPNLRWANCKDEIWIKDGFLYSNLNDCKIYINYQKHMVDDADNLLVVDDDIINEYYEYALKERILENLFIMGEDVAQKIQLMQQKLRVARKEALSYVNTPDFAVMKNVWQMNRNAQYSKYYSMFASYAPNDFRAAPYRSTFSNFR